MKENQKISFFIIIYSPILIIAQQYISFNFFNFIMMWFIVYYILFVEWDNKKVIFIITLILIFINININKEFNSINGILTYRFVFCSSIMLIVTNEKAYTAIRNNFLSNINVVKKVCLVSVGFLLLVAIFKNSYETIWGGTKYFRGPFTNPHQCGYYLVSLLAVNTVIKRVKRSWKYYLVDGLILLLVFMTGARTPLIVAGAVMINDFIYDFKFRGYQFIFNTLIISILTVITILSGIFLKIPFVNKMIFAIQQGQFSSGRDVFWKDLLSYFSNNYNFSEKLFGKGIDFAFYLNKISYGMEIWSHNDFIQILLSFGLIVVLIYAFIMLGLKKRTNIITFVSIVLLAWFNGFFSYQYFVLTIIYLSLLKENGVDLNENIVDCYVNK